FCEISPFCYRISEKKEQLKRWIRDLADGDDFAALHDTKPLTYLWKGHTSPMLRELHGVDMQLQYNKITNLKLSGEKIHGLIIKPGQTFSFWRTTGPCTKSRGYIDGLVIRGTSFAADTGGGICQLANLIHYMVLHSPLTVTELHHHSDALFPDSGRRVPFGTGTSVGYNMFDYRFRNDTEGSVQLLIWQEGNMLCGELRGERELKVRYKLTEEDHCYTKEGEVYYRNSKIKRTAYAKDDGTVAESEIILVNHSRVMYDPALIPEKELVL
ncbi:MAG: VanW family protein, partial [Clostridia bacterium]|nr:VanW family protein [Clostridia bacterium]